MVYEEIADDRDFLIGYERRTEIVTTKKKLRICGICQKMEKSNIKYKNITKNITNINKCEHFYKKP